MENIIEIKNLKKKYDDKFELGEIDITIPKGVIVGLIGENGAGKTTLIKLMLNIIKSDNGEIKIFGKDNKRKEKEIKEDIGVVLDNMFFPELLNAKDINNSMKDIYKNWDSKLYFSYLKEFDLPDNKSLKSMSKGMRKKLEIATALAHKPKLLILDEPTSGLDPVIRNEVLDIFQKFIEDEEHGVLLSTHITSDLEHIADEIIFIDKGKKVLQKSRDEIIDNYGILKCDIDYFSNIDKKDIITYKKTKYAYEILVDDKEKTSKKYPSCVIDKITLEDLMVLVIKGEKVC
ncbi:MAG: ABC transporter ATP-binding protein [Clostridia bacterium]